MVLAATTYLDLLPLLSVLLTIATMSLPVLAFPTSLPGDVTNVRSRQAEHQLKNGTDSDVIKTLKRPSRSVSPGARHARDVTSEWSQRLLWPCAGRRQFSVKTLPDAPMTSLSVTPSGVLLRLSHDAAAARRQVELLRMRFELSRFGGVPPQEALFYFSLQQPGGAHNHPLKLADLLTTTYRRLARATRHLATIRRWETSRYDSFHIDMDHVIEHSLLNLLCGTKVVLGALGHAPTPQTLEGAVGEALSVPPSDALRYLAEFKVIAGIEYLLREVKVVYRNITVF